MENNLVTLKRRLERIGIDIELNGNWPLCYLTEINGQPVKEKFMSEHGWVVGFMVVKTGQLKITNIPELFNLIRQYVKNGCREQIIIM